MRMLCECCAVTICVSFDDRIGGLRRTRAVSFSTMIPELLATNMLLELRNLLELGSQLNPSQLDLVVGNFSVYFLLCRAVIPLLYLMGRLWCIQMPSDAVMSVLCCICLYFLLFIDLVSTCEKSGAPVDVMLFILDSENNLTAFTDQRDQKGVGFSQHRIKILGIQRLDCMMLTGESEIGEEDSWVLIVNSKSSDDLCVNVNHERIFSYRLLKYVVSRRAIDV